MNFFILSASHRPQSQSNKVAKFFQFRSETILKNINTTFLSLENNPVPLWDEGVWNNTPLWQEKWSPIKAQLQNCDAFIAVTPEWGGMSTPALRNFMLLASGGPLSHKPGLICSVSASRNGAYPVSELRSNTTKNNQLCWIPEHIIVREVEKVLNPGDATNDDDKYLRNRIDYSLKLLNEYAKAFQQIRSSGVIDSKNYPFGM